MIEYYWTDKVWRELPESIVSMIEILYIEIYCTAVYESHDSGICNEYIQKFIHVW